VSEVFLDVAFVDFGRTGEASAQGMAGEQSHPVFFGEIGPDASIQYCLLDQTGDVFVIQPGFRGALAIAGDADENVSEIELRKMQPLLERMDGAGLILRAALQRWSRVLSFYARQHRRSSRSSSNPRRA